MPDPFIPHQVPHDLPEYTPNNPVPIAWNRVQVYKECGHWTWHHVCPWRPESTPAHGYPHMTHRIAMAFAWDHVRRCL